MAHEAAKAVFEEIRARAYRVSVASDEVSNNCYFKGIELMQRLEALGYRVRGRLGETYWQPLIFGMEILSLWPKDITVTHFFVEVEIDGVWRALDPSLQPGMEWHGFKVCEFDEGGVCFPITKLYTDEESREYQATWADEMLVADYFERAGPALRALNNWFARNE
ncbi:MAG: hypothetical protein EON60_05210 [Alphaproteobacteria bacterium]|nr:MAG: hypothetical protein EON60_05210 [Alphaproteobacteria bacterium]